MYAIRIIGLTTLMFLSGCGNTTETRPDWCQDDSLILPSRNDQLSPGTARQIVLHNDQGKVVCGW